MNNQALKLLPPEALLKTGAVNHADWNFRVLLGAISRLRFKVVVALLASQRYRRLLEVGYGSGVFMLELSRRCDKLYGIDVHQMQGPVAELLGKRGVAARLHLGSVAAMPFDEKFFDCIVAVSALEFVENLDAACDEIKRVLAPHGSLIVVTPGRSPVVDFGLKILTGENARNDFSDRRRSLIPTLLKHFVVQKRLTIPSLGSSVIHLYTALQLRA